jgi:hypothetical protein
MNVYDPADGIRYVHMSGPAVRRSAPPNSMTACSPLPAGYANRSPLTRLQRRDRRVTGLQRPPARRAPENASLF